MKLITPILYFGLTFILTATSVLIEMMSRNIGILGPYQNKIDTPTILLFTAAIIIIGIPLYWYTNKAISKLEKARLDTVSSSLRINSLYILTIIFIVGYWAFNGFKGDEENAYQLLWLGISILAVSINVIYNRRTS